LIRFRLWFKLHVLLGFRYVRTCPTHSKDHSRNNFEKIGKKKIKKENFERKSGSGLESGEYGRKDTSRLPRDTLYPQKLALTSLTSGGRLVGVVRSRTQATEILLLYVHYSESSYIE
jgi:hypothetical protein